MLSGWRRRHSGGESRRLESGVAVCCYMFAKEMFCRATPRVTGYSHCHWIVEDDIRRFGHIIPKLSSLGLLVDSRSRLRLSIHKAGQSTALDFLVRLSILPSSPPQHKPLAT